FFFSSRRRHTRFSRDWSSDVCSSDLPAQPAAVLGHGEAGRGRGGDRPGPDQPARVAPQLRHPPAQPRRRPARAADAAGPQFAVDHPDLYPGGAREAAPAPRQAPPPGLIPPVVLRRRKAPGASDVSVNIFRPRGFAMRRPVHSVPRPRRRLLSCVLAAALLVPGLAGAVPLELNELEYFHKRGLDVLAFNNYY